MDKIAPFHATTSQDCHRTCGGINCAHIKEQVKWICNFIVCYEFELAHMPTDTKSNTAGCKFAVSIGSIYVLHES